MRHLYIFLILNCLLYGPFIIFGPSEDQKLVHVYRFINNCIWSSWELQYSICNMTIKSICYKKKLKIYLKNLFYYIIPIFRTWLHKSEFIIAIVAVVIDVTHWSLVIIINFMSKSDTDLITCSWTEDQSKLKPFWLLCTRFLPMQNLFPPELLKTLTRGVNLSNLDVAHRPLIRMLKTEMYKIDTQLQIANIYSYIYN